MCIYCLTQCSNCFTTIIAICVTVIFASSGDSDVERAVEGHNEQEYNPDLIVKGDRNLALKEVRHRSYKKGCRGVATSMIAPHKKPRHDLIVVLHLKSCGAAEKS